MIRSTILFAILTLIITSCGSDDNNNGTGPADDAPRVRLLHAVYDGGGLDMRVNGELIHENVKFLESSGYKATLDGSREVSVHLTGNTAVLKLATRSLSKGGFYTMYCYPPQAAFAAGVESDAMATSPENARIKFVNASFAATQALEEYAIMVTGTKTTLHSYIRRTEATQYVDVVAGMYSFTLKLKNDTTFSRTYNLVNLDPASAYTIVLHGTRDESDAYPLALRMYKDNGSKTEVVDFVETPTANMLFLSTIASVGQVDVAVDGGSPQIKGLTYSKDSGYRFFGVGQHAYTVSTGTTPLILGQSINISAAKNYTVVLVGDGNQNNIEAIQLEDAITPNPTQALVRFVHTVSDAPAVNVITELGPGNDYPIPGMQGIAYKGVGKSASTGSEFLVIPPGQYDLRFFDAGADTVLNTAAGVKFDQGKIYTLWYGGRMNNTSLRAITLLHN